MDDTLVGPVRVERTHGGGVLVAAARSRAILDSLVPGGYFLGASGPQIHASPSVSSPGHELARSVEWPATPDVAVRLESNELSIAELLEVAGEVTVTSGGLLVLPTMPIGARAGGLRAPGLGVATGYSAKDDGDLVSLHVVPETVQAAFEALMIPRPSTSDVIRSAASCCPEAIYGSPRAVKVNGVTGTVGTVTPQLRALVVSGDPGLVVVSSGGLSDDALVAIAEAAVPVEPDVLTLLLDRRESVDDDRHADDLEGGEYLRGYQALDRWETESRPTLLSFGFDEREPLDVPDGPDLQPGMARLCAISWATADATTCLPVAPPPTAVVVAPTPLNPHVVWGLALADVQSIEVEVGDATVAGTIRPVHPPGAAPLHVFHVGVSRAELISLMSPRYWRDPFGAFTSVVFVALDADGNELARVPLFPNR